MQSKAGLKPATFAAMQVGEELGPLQVTVDEHFVRTHAFTIADDRSWPTTPLAPTGPASLLVPNLLRLLNTVYDPDTETGLHQREEIWLHSPLRLGETVELRGRFVGKYVKRGKGYIVTDAEAVSLNDGRLVGRHRAIEMAETTDDVEVGGGSAPPPTRRVLAEVDPSLAPVARAAPDLAPRTPVLGPTKTVHQDQMAVFSNIADFWHNIHTDLEAARRAGSDRTIAQGLMATMYVAEMAGAFFGESWQHTGWASLTFLAPVYAGDTVTLHGAVLDPDLRADHQRLELEVWIDTQHGQRAAVGWIGASV